MPAAADAAPGHSMYTSVWGANSMMSGTDGKPNYSLSYGDGGTTASSCMVEATGACGAGGAHGATTCWLINILTVQT